MPHLPLSVRFLAAALLASGCAGTNAQVSQIQSEKQELLDTVKAKSDENEALQKKTASLEKRLDQSEKEIASLTGRKGAFVDEPRMASSKSNSLPVPSAEGGEKSAHHPLPRGESRSDDLSVPKREEKLPWRSPAGPATAPKPATTPPKEAAASGPTKAAAKPAPTLRSLAQRDSRLQYDATTDTARFQQEILFEASGSALTSTGRKRLDDLANWLKAEETKDLRVLVTAASSSKDPKEDTHRDSAPARATAVANYLGSLGITEDRLVLVGPGSPAQLLGEPAGGPVQIHLAQSSAPILGRISRQPALRR